MSPSWRVGEAFGTLMLERNGNGFKHHFGRGLMISPEFQRLAKRVEHHVDRNPQMRAAAPMALTYLKGTPYAVAFIIKWVRAVVDADRDEFAFYLRSLTDSQIGIAVRYYLTHTEKIEEDIRQLERFQESPNPYASEALEGLNRVLTEPNQVVSEAERKSENHGRKRG